MNKEEIYWLEILDRNKVAGFMLGDIYVMKDGTTLTLNTTSKVRKAELLYARNDFQGIYPSMSFRRFPEGSEQE